MEDTWTIHLMDIPLFDGCFYKRNFVKWLFGLEVYFYEHVIVGKEKIYKACLRCDNDVLRWWKRDQRCYGRVDSWTVMKSRLVDKFYSDYYDDIYCSLRRKLDRYHKKRRQEEHDRIANLFHKLEMHLDVCALKAHIRTLEEEVDSEQITSDDSILQEDVNSDAQFVCEEKIEESESESVIHYKSESESTTLYDELAENAKESEIKSSCEEEIKIKRKEDVKKRDVNFISSNDFHDRFYEEVLNNSYSHEATMNAVLRRMIVSTPSEVYNENSRTNSFQEGEYDASMARRNHTHIGGVNIAGCNMIFSFINTINWKHFKWKEAKWTNIKKKNWRKRLGSISLALVKKVKKEQCPVKKERAPVKQLSEVTKWSKRVK